MSEHGLGQRTSSLAQAIVAAVEHGLDVEFRPSLARDGVEVRVLDREGGVTRVVRFSDADRTNTPIDVALRWAFDRAVHDYQDAVGDGDYLPEPDGEYRGRDPW